MIKKIFLVLSISVFASTLGDGIVSPLLPLYIRDMGATGIWLGIVIAATFISNSIAVPIAGGLSDRKGRKAFLTAGFLAASIISLSYIWARDVSLLALIRFVHGAIGALIAPIALAYVGDLSPEGEEGKWMGYSNATFFSGFGLGPFVGGLLSEHFGMTASFISMSSLNLLAFIIAFFFLPKVSPRKMTEKPRISLRQISDSNMVKGLFSFRMAQALGFGGIGTFLPIFASAIGMKTSLIGILLSVNILAVTLFNPPIGFIADRFSRRALTVIGSLLLTAFLVAIPLAGSFWPLLVILLFQGLGSAICTTASSALTVEEGRRFGMGSMMSMLFLAMSIGMASGPIASGAIAQLLDINWVFYFGGVASLMGTIAFIWFTRRRTN
ncbi:MAG: MFS transporter [Chloroflexi bacterium]|nr:MFS transporter [Chloroflexota bacterium]